MTPFMSAVAEAARGQPAAPPPATVPSIARPQGEGADRQVAVRALAEQLVCEANAVLAGAGQRIELTDHPGDRVLAFTLRYRSQEAEVSTRFADGIARAWLRGPGGADQPARELAAPAAVEELILGLVAGHHDAGRHDAGHDGAGPGVPPPARSEGGTRAV